MRTSLVGCFAVVLLLVAGCDKRKAEDQGQVVEDPIQEPGDTNAPFTPPEIRRSYDSAAKGVGTADTAVAARPDSASRKPATPAGDAAKVVAPTVKAMSSVEPAPASAPAAKEPTAAKPARPAAAVEGVQGPGETGDWVVQVGIHKSEDGARGMVAKLGSIGIPAYVVQAAANAGLSGSYWRVRVGRFVLRGDAQKFGESVLKPAGYSFWVDRKANEAPSAGGTP